MLILRLLLLLGVFMCPVRCARGLQVLQLLPVAIIEGVLGTNLLALLMEAWIASVFAVVGQCVERGAVV